MFINGCVRAGFTQRLVSVQWAAQLRSGSQSMRVQTPSDPITYDISPGEFCLPMQPASSSRSSRCEVQLQHSDRTWAIVLFFPCEVAKVALPQCEPPWANASTEQMMRPLSCHAYQAMPPIFGQWTTLIPRPNPYYRWPSRTGRVYGSVLLTFPP